MEKPMIGVDLTQEDIQNMFNVLLEAYKDEPNFEKDFKFLMAPKPYVVTSYRFNNYRYFLRDLPDMRLFFDRLYAYKRKKAESGDIKPELSVRLGIVIDLDIDPV